MKAKLYDSESRQPLGFLAYGIECNPRAGDIIDLGRVGRWKVTRRTITTRQDLNGEYDATDAIIDVVRENLPKKATRKRPR